LSRALRLAADTVLAHIARRVCRAAAQELFERAKLASEGKLLGWGAAGRTPLRTRSSGGPAAAPASSPPAAAGRSVGAVDSEATDAAARRKWAQAEQLTRAAAKQVLQQAEVVCATCAGAGDPMLSNM
jgi:hypothetical protein